MVYKDQFVAVITHNGQILRETRHGQEDVLQLPYNAEYGIRLKNLSSNRAAIGAEIDGKDILGGHRIVLRPGETHDLEGFMENGVVRNKLKFIQKTQKIAEHRGDFIEDGIIRVTCQFEKPYEPCKPVIAWHNHWPYRNTYTDPYSPHFQKGCDRLIGAHQPYDDLASSRSVLRGFAGPQGQSMSNNVECSAKSFTSAPEPPQPAQDEGITVKGSQTNINYDNTYLRELYPEVTVITFKLVGVSINNVKIARPVTVRRKIRCETCGRNNNSRHAFCTECGTSLR